MNTFKDIKLDEQSNHFVLASSHEIIKLKTESFRQGKNEESKNISEQLKNPLLIKISD